MRKRDAPPSHPEQGIQGVYIWGVDMPFTDLVELVWRIMAAQMLLLVLLAIVLSIPVSLALCVVLEGTQNN